MGISGITLRTLRARYYLTPREIEVVDLIATGASNKAIAHMLAVSPRTVEVHRARAILKLQTRNTALLVLKACALAIEFPEAFPLVYSQLDSSAHNRGTEFMSISKP